MGSDLEPHLVVNLTFFVLDSANWIQQKYCKADSSRRNMVLSKPAIAEWFLVYWCRCENVPRNYLAH